MNLNGELCYPFFGGIFKDSFNYYLAEILIHALLTAHQSPPNGGIKNKFCAGIFEG